MSVKSATEIQKLEVEMQTLSEIARIEKQLAEKQHQIRIAIIEQQNEIEESRSQKTEHNISEKLNYEEQYVEKEYDDKVKKWLNRSKNDDIQNLSNAIQSFKINHALPTFSGDCMEWLGFKYSYENTAESFSDSENLSRLRLALKGDAKECVSVLLYTEKEPDQIISTLERRFGRPESIVKEQVNSIKKLPKIDNFNINSASIKIQNCVAILKSLNKVGYLYSPELYEIIVGKLTWILKSKYVDFASEQEQNEPPLVSLSRFLNNEADKVLKYCPEERLDKGRKHTVAAINDFKCGYCCKSNHGVTTCYEFKKLTIQKRWDWARSKRLCFLCLKGSHQREACRYTKCKTCNGLHHSLLHDTRKYSTDSKRESEPQASTSDVSEIVSNMWTDSEPHAIVKIAPVTVTGPKGSIDTYALLDDGATISLLSTNIAKKIGARGPKNEYSLGSLNHSQNVKSEKVKISIKGRNIDNSFDINVRTIDKLKLLTQSLSYKDIEKCEHLQELKDQILYYEHATPTILIGQDNWDLLVPTKIKMRTKNEPAASYTSLGWVVNGCIPNPQRPKNVFFVNIIEWQLLHNMVKNNFELEAIGVSNKPRVIPEEERADKILTETAIRCENNKWEVGLLWKKDETVLPNNYIDALKRLKMIENKMNKNEKFSFEYTSQINNLLKCGYAEKVQNVPDNVWYLPHFAVTNPNKPDKIRIVFDAAARTKGISLNDVLMAGPDLLQSLLSVIFKFRQRKIAIIGDIKEMFLQIKIRKEDQYAQHFLWRNDKNQPPDTYVMTSLIFGATSSPCTAIYIKNKNAEELSTQYPAGASAVIEKHYMDDYLDSLDDITQAKNLIYEVSEIHRQGGFDICKWSSNKLEVLEDIPREKRAKDLVDLTLHNDVTEKTLGLMWAPDSDTFGFNTNMARVKEEIKTGEKRPTKREVLSVVMSIYDPLGLLAPIIIQAKILIQDIWRSGIEWDQELLNKEHDKWEIWIKQIILITKIKIPRCYNIQSYDNTAIQLHVFCDASEKAYAAAAYWRFKYKDGFIKCTLIASKSRVTPLKPISIPRLELQAAVLGGRLAETIIKQHEIQPDCKKFWTDSKTTLSWIKSDPRHYKAYVAHRLAELDTTTQTSEWRWVPSEKNVADDATRDNSIEFNSDARWFHGPQFLYEDESHWPDPPKIKQPENDKEKKAACFVITVVEPLINITRFSSFLRLIRAMSFVFLFIEKCRKLNVTNIEPHHLQKAEIWLLKICQNETFNEEIQLLRNNKPIEKSSSLCKLKPVFDDNDILRLGGRIDELQDINIETKRPVLLHGKHYLVKLIIMTYHEKMNHANTETVINELRQKYWIINLRSTVKSTIYTCQYCKIQKSKPYTPDMGNLPAARLAHHHRPFTHCGLDYFGPIEVTIGRRREKRYGALFTCMTTRAIHLELAGSLSTDSAIMAIRRMMARRGRPDTIYSDNGTNFRGASKELQKALHEDQSIKDYLNNHEIHWKFIPPSAPNMGGCWERMVRSVKTSLAVILKERAPKEETLLTLLAEVENIVNSRPLTHISPDSEDLEALTPNHFLLGSSSGVPTPGAFNNRDLCLRKQWRIAQRLADMFWSRWMREYLPTLLPRAKSGHNKYKNIKVDDIVLVADNNLPRNIWPRGRVSATYPGKDGIVRVVEITTNHSTVKRPASKVIVLPTD